MIEIVCDCGNTTWMTEDDADNWVCKCEVDALRKILKICQKCNAGPLYCAHCEHNTENERKV